MAVSHQNVGHPCSKQKKKRTLKNKQQDQKFEKGTQKNLQRKRRGFTKWIEKEHLEQSEFPPFLNL